MMRVKRSRYRQTYWELFGRKKRDKAIENQIRRKTNFIFILIWYVAGPNFRWCGQKKSISVIIYGATEESKQTYMTTDYTDTLHERPAANCDYYVMEWSGRRTGHRQRSQ